MWVLDLSTLVDAATYQKLLHGDPDATDSSAVRAREAGNGPADEQTFLTDQQDHTNLP